MLCPALVALQVAYLDGRTSAFAAAIAAEPNALPSMPVFAATQVCLQERQVDASMCPMPLNPDPGAIYSAQATTGNIHLQRDRLALTCGKDAAPSARA